ncbi:MAG: alpha/beta hydrolase [Thermodesulfobacteriota bacterium]
MENTEKILSDMANNDASKHPSTETPADMASRALHRRIGLPFDTTLRLNRHLMKNMMQHLQTARKNTGRFFFNELVARCINGAYNSYSRFYEGQLRLGLPVSRELLKSQAELRAIAAGKLALTLYHIFLRVTGTRIPRSQIKNVLIAELEAGNLRLTENVIILSKKQLKELTINRFKIPAFFFAGIYEEATRRRILKETLKSEVLPAYFDSEIEETTQNGRGDYEIVYYRDFTDEGKEIKFRRLVSIEAVTSGDDRPSVILVPGFANNSNCYNLTNQQSLAKDLADQGDWVYLFDPRGMGINRGKFDPLYTVDTLIDHDLPTVLHFIHQRSKKKPSVLVGHSMGGIIAESMLLNWGIRQQLNELETLTAEQKTNLNKFLPAPEEARTFQKEVRAVISMGSPKFFNKFSHAFYPSALWLNHLSRVLRLRNVPLKEVLSYTMQFPILSDMLHHLVYSNVGELNFLLCPENQRFSKEFTHWYINHALESVPLGLGFQFLKAIYNGEGFKRMDESRLNYSNHLHCFPSEIPVFHIWGAKDPLAPPDNANYSQYYPHRIKKTYRIESVKDAEQVEIPQERSLLIDFVIEGANHLDLLYGKLADEIIYPLVARITQETWGDWTYDGSVDSALSLTQNRKAN